MGVFSNFGIFDFFYSFVGFVVNYVLRVFLEVRECFVLFGIVSRFLDWFSRGVRSWVYDRNLLGWLGGDSMYFVVRNYGIDNLNVFLKSGCLGMIVFWVLG